MPIPTPCGKLAVIQPGDLSEVQAEVPHRLSGVTFVFIYLEVGAHSKSRDNSPTSVTITILSPPLPPPPYFGDAI